MNKEALLKDVRTKLEVEYPGAIPLFITIGGSHSHGTATETSDIDFRGVYLKPKVDFYGGVGLEEVTFDNNNTSMWELSKLIKGIIGNNPAALELIHTTEDCVLYQHPIMNDLISRRREYLSKICLHTFTAYGSKQNEKAKGKDKMNNWEKSRTIRKTPIDFCYLLQVNRSVLIEDFIKDNPNYKLEHFGLCKQPHSQNNYSLFYDYQESGKFRGIVIEKSNEVRLTSIPKEMVESSFVGYLSFNKEGYSKHCSDYKKYEHYLKTRNNDRWVQVQNSDSKIDGKNMSHTQRLVDVGTEIGLGMGIIMKRENREYLLEIKRGEHDLEALLVSSQKQMEAMIPVYAKSDLPDRPSREIVDYLNNYLTKTRFEIYE